MNKEQEIMLSKYFNLLKKNDEYYFGNKLLGSKYLKVLENLIKIPLDAYHAERAAILFIEESLGFEWDVKCSWGLHHDNNHEYKHCKFLNNTPGSYYFTNREWPLDKILFESNKKGDHWLSLDRSPEGFRRVGLPKEWKEPMDKFTKVMFERVLKKDENQTDESEISLSLVGQNVVLLGETKYEIKSLNELKLSYKEIINKVSVSFDLGPTMICDLFYVDKDQRYWAFYTGEENIINKISHEMKNDGWTSPWEKNDWSFGIPYNYLHSMGNIEKECPIPWIVWRFMRILKMKKTTLSFSWTNPNNPTNITLYVGDDCDISSAIKSTEEAIVKLEISNK